MRSKEKEKGDVGKIMRLKKTEKAMGRKREIAGGEIVRRTKLALTIVCNSNRSRGERGR